MATKFMQVSPMPSDGLPESIPHRLASFTVGDRSYLGRVAFLGEDGSFDETGEGTKAVFLYENAPPTPPGARCSVHEFYKGIVPGAFVETQGKIISTFMPGSEYVIHGISYDEIDVHNRG